jgi:hypothetical protein
MVFCHKRNVPKRSSPAKTLGGSRPAASRLLSPLGSAHHHIDIPAATLRAHKSRAPIRDRRLGTITLGHLGRSGIAERHRWAAGCAALGRAYQKSRMTPATLNSRPMTPGFIRYVNQEKTAHLKSLKLPVAPYIRKTYRGRRNFVKLSRR